MENGNDQDREFGTPRSILVVDDTRLNATLLKAMLEGEHRVSVAYSGREALAAIERDVPDLILLDIMMPEIDGMEVCRRLKKMPDQRSRIPVIFVTAAHDPAIEEAAFALGAVDFIHKPISAPVAMARVRTHLALAAHTLDLEGQILRRSAELTRAMSELTQNERLATMGSMVAGFTHEIYSPLTNLRGVTESVRDRVAVARRAMTANTLRKSDMEALFLENERGADLVEVNVQRAMDLIESFKLVAVDQTSMRRRKFMLHELIEKTLHAIGPVYKRLPVEVSVDLANDMALDTVPGAIEQIVTNLMSNAVKHAMPIGAEARLQITIKAVSSEDGRCQLSFIDDGVGMAPDLAARVFDRFFTTKPDQGGTGLGLYLVSSLVTETLQGVVQLQSTPGQGSRFLIDIPANLPTK